VQILTVFHGVLSIHPFTYADQLGSGPKRDEIIGWRKLHHKELHNLYTSPNIISMIKSRRISWAGREVRLRWESQKERDNYEDQDVRGRMDVRETEWGW
jgi:hypothetical protein